MRSIASLKTLPYIGLAAYAIFRALPGYKNRKANAAKDIPHAGIITGSVTKVLKDDIGYLISVRSGKDSYWLYSDSELAPVGSGVEFGLGKCVDAYESKSLGMAFEKVYFVRQFVRLPT